jgi:NAD(P)H-dependent FMN reductase
MSLNLGIIIGSTREGSVGPQVADWVKENVAKYTDANLSILNIADYDLPFLGTVKDAPGVVKWNQALEKLDGFIFITAEYNHSVTGALKNALDSAKDAWANKAAAIVGYGSAGGSRAAIHLKVILNELQVATVRTQVLLSMFTEFEKWSTFKPQDIHTPNLKEMTSQLVKWSTALKTTRN